MGKIASRLDTLVGKLAELHTQMLLADASLRTQALPPEEYALRRADLEQLEHQAMAFLGILYKDHGIRLTMAEYKKQGRGGLKKALQNAWSGPELAAAATANLPVTVEDAARPPLRELFRKRGDPASLPPPGPRVFLPAAPSVEVTSPPPLGPPPTVLPVAVGPSPSERIDSERAAEDFRYFCAKVLKIPYRAGVRRDLDRSVSSGPFIFTVPQDELAMFLVMVLLVQKKPLRAQLLKARQLGFTTLLLAFWVWLLVTHDNFNLLFLIDKHEHNATKIRLVRQWLEVDIPAALPDWPRFASQPGNQIVCTNKSTLFFESSDSNNPGTSEAIRLYHESEMAKWEGRRADDIRASVLPGLSLEPMTAHINESTAQGTEKFAAMWAYNNRLDREPDDAVPLFFGWFKSPEYTKDPPPSAYGADGKFLYRDGDDAYMDDGGQDGSYLLESEYARKYGLTDGQIYWRRTKINEFGSSAVGHQKRVLFDQEFPTTPKHAFRASGRGYFPETTLAYAEDHFVRPPRAVGRLLPIGWAASPGTVVVPRYTQVRPMWMEDPTGELYVWEYPLEGEKYYLGGDVAEGRDANPEVRDDPDFTVFGVRRSDGRPVAYWRARLEPEVCLMPLLLLGLWYGIAYMNVERDGPGNTLLSWLWETGYPHLLVWPEPRSRPVKQRVWTTLKGGTGGTTKRSEYLSLLRSSVMANAARVVWSVQLAEYRAFVPSRTGKPQARGGAHDDIVLCDLHTELCRMFFQGFLKSQSADDTVVVKTELTTRPPAPEGQTYAADSFFLDGDQEVLGDYI